MTHRMDALDVSRVRDRFPALNSLTVYLDGPAGSQVPTSVVDAVATYLAYGNANSGGAFASSRTTDAMVARARAAAAALLGVADAEPIAFGPNMTTLTFGLAHALGRTWGPGDEIVVTRFDHDANIWPWVRAAEDAGATVRWAELLVPSCTLELEQLEALIGPRTRLVAIGAASNAVGSLTPIAAIVALAHAHGAEVFVDAVHLAPHRLLEVDAWGCDYVACSAYKFFGPHLGLLWGRRERMAALPAYQVRPAQSPLAKRWMTGTPSFEAIAGTLAAIDYLTALGGGTGAGDRRADLARAFAAIRAHEDALCRRLLVGLARRPVTVWGIADPGRVAERVATIGFSHHRRRPQEIAEALAARGIQVWAGHFYAIETVQALGVGSDGIVRVGLLHYNTADEVDRFLEALDDLT
jgi:cysteine desulfurase family protein (TIGR01976 family)